MTWPMPMPTVVWSWASRMALNFTQPSCTPCEHEVLQRVSVGGLAGHELPGVRIVADGVDQISVLHKQAAIDLADGLVTLRRLGHLEDAQVLLLGLQQFERGRLIVGGDDDFGENRAHAFGHLKGDLGVAGDHTAVGAHRVAGVSLLVGLGRGRADGQTAQLLCLTTATAMAGAISHTVRQAASAST